MKRFILCTLLVVAFGVYSHAQSQFKKSEFAWGLSAGGVHGDNNITQRHGHGLRRTLTGRELRK